VNQNSFDFRAPIARWRDPIGAHMAAVEQDASGRRDNHAATILDAVRRRPGLTYRELHGYLGGLIAEPVEVQRRLSDLQNERLVEKSGKRPCRVTGRMASTWAVAEEREVAA
jgi:hypothetical protein